MNDESEAAVGPMVDPAHPGELARYECLEPLGLSVTAGAEVLGVSRKTLNNLVNGRAGVSPEMAVHLATAFGGSAQAWITMQAQYDNARVSRNEVSILETIRLF